MRGLIVTPHGDNALRQWASKGSSLPSSITWNLVRNANSAGGPGNLCFYQPPGDSDAGSSLRTSALTETEKEGRGRRSRAEQPAYLSGLVR